MTSSDTNGSPAPAESKQASVLLSPTWQLLIAASLCTSLATAAGFWLGSHQSNSSPGELPQVLASTAAASKTMAVATGPISDDAEGIFFLDFITGDLRCLVYYPRQRMFGAHFGSNVLPQFQSVGKNAQFMLVTGGAVSKATSGGARPGNSLVYVTDATSGMFAAYAVPWDQTAEASGRQQSGPLRYVGGGPIRNFQMPNVGQNQPAGIVNPQP